MYRWQLRESYPGLLLLKLFLQVHSVTIGLRLHWNKENALVVLHERSEDHEEFHACQTLAQTLSFAQRERRYLLHQRRIVDEALWVELLGVLEVLLVLVYSGHLADDLHA